MADQRLRLIAELKNNASPGLKQISKDLKEVGVSPGMEAAGKWFRGFSESASGFVKDGGGIASTMGSIGIGGLTAAASLAELVKQFKELGDHTFTMKRLGQETGLTLDQISRWEYVGQVFRVPVEQMDAALKTLGDQMVDFKRRRGELFGQLNQLDPRFAEKLQLEDTQHQLQDIFTWLSKIPDAAARNRWAKEFFGTDDLSSLLTNGLPALQKAITDANKNVDPISKDFEQKADELNSAVVAFNQAWRNFEVEVGPSVFNQLKLAADDFRGVFDEIKGVAEAVATAIKPFTDWLDHEKGRTLPQMTGDAVKDSIQGLKDAAKKGAGEDGNALHRNDETTIAPSHKSSGKGWFGGLFGGSVEKSAYVTGLDGNPFGGGDSSGLADGVKEGVLAAFREWVAESVATKAAAGGGRAGVQNAAYTTFGSDGGTGGSAGGGFGSLNGANLSGGDATGEHAGYIRQLAAKYGIDPRVAVAVAKSEGLGAAYGVGDHGTSFGDFQLHRGGLADIFERETGLRANDPNNWKAADDWALKYASKNGWAPWHGAAHIGVTGMAGIAGRSVGSNAAGGASMPGHIGGKLKIGDESFNFGSGGAGNASIPLGDYPITPGTIGAWGQANGALGINNNHIWDKALGRMRAGIEMHAGSTAALITEGCVAFEQQQWPHVKDKVLGMIRRDGAAYLHVGKNGASITSTPSLVDEARKAAEPQRADSSRSQVDIHLHDRGGHVRSTGVQSDGAMKVNLRRGPTMTRPSIEA